MNFVKFSHIFNISSGYTPDTSNLNYYENGDINWLNSGDFHNTEINYTNKKVSQLALSSLGMKLYKPGTVCVAMYGANVGEVGMLNIKATCNQACAMLSLKNKKENPLFYFYVLISLKKYLEAKANGGGQQNINQNILKSLYVKKYTYAEQTSIANFLDHHVSRIDRQTNLLEQKAERLEEYRQALIYEMVTKGFANDINTYVGITKSKRLKDLGILNPSINYTFENKTGSFVPMERLKEGSIDLSEENTFDNMKKGYTFFQNNDVVVATVTPCFENGKAALALNLKNGYAFGSSELMVYRPKRIVNKYAYYLMASKGFKEFCMTNMKGVGGLKRINQNQASTYIVPIMDTNEQTAIANFLDTETSKIDVKVSLIRKKIELLKEYKQSLIYEAVTGKIDVNTYDAKAA